MFDPHILLSGDYRDWLLAGLLLSLQLMAITLLLSLPLACGAAMLRLAPTSAVVALTLYTAAYLAVSLAIAGASFLL